MIARFFSQLLSLQKKADRQPSFKLILIHRDTNLSPDDIEILKSDLADRIKRFMHRDRNNPEILEPVFVDDRHPYHEAKSVV